MAVAEKATSMGNNEVTERMGMGLGNLVSAAWLGLKNTYAINDRQSSSR